MKIRKDSWLYRNIDEIIEDFSSFGDPIILSLIWLMIFKLSVNYLLIFIFGMIFIEIIGSAIKIFFFKDRPERMDYKTTLDKVYAGSFPSIHVARATFVFSFISTIYTGVLVILFSLIMAGVSFSRLYLRKHYIEDVFGGFVLGLFAIILTALFL